MTGYCSFRGAIILLEQEFSTLTACRWVRAVPIFSAGGKYTREFFFPFGHFVVLSGIFRNYILKRKDRNIPEIFRPDKTLFRDGLVAGIPVILFANGPGILYPGYPLPVQDPLISHFQAGITRIVKPSCMRVSSWRYVRMSPSFWPCTCSAPRSPPSSRSRFSRVSS